MMQSSAARQLIVHHTTSHVWKKTNVFIQSYGKKQFDTYRCENCGITGKRFGPHEVVHRDHTFKAKVYADCATSTAHLAVQRQVLMRKRTRSRSEVVGDDIRLIRNTQMHDANGSHEKMQTMGQLEQGSR
jgi:hypothetical protein